MKHKPYPKYKPSGIEWIGEIPEWWSLKRIRFNFRISKGRKPEEIGLLEEEGYAPYLSMEYLRGERKEAMWAKIDRNCIKVRDGDVLLLWDGANAGEFVCGKSGVVSSTMVKIEALQGDENYFKHFFKAYENILKKNSIGMGIPHVDGNFLTNSFVILPEKKEQQQIADFLDHKTAQIDDLIQKKEEMIKLLKEKRAVIINQAVTKGLEPNAKMKPSGIDWIGDIPEGWGIRRLKFLTKINSKGTTPSTIGREILSDGNIRFLKAENIQEGEIQKYPEFFIDEETNKLLKRSELKEEDILFVIAGATIGKAGLLKKEFLPANTNQAVSFVRLVKGVNKKFILYWLQSVYIKRLTWLNAVQSAQPNLSMESLGDFAIPYPGTKEEQQQITNYLNEKTERMDSLIQIIETAIAKLREYRSSIITAAVTGKIDVREVGV